MTKRRKSKEYKAIIIEDGSMNVLDKKFKSPSYVALLEIQDAGSDRKTVNGWTSWKNKEGELLFIVIWFLQYCFSQKLPKKKGSTNFSNNSRYQCSYNTYSVALLVISPDSRCQ